MFASVLVVDLHLPVTDSLKAKRAVITPILEGARRRHRVASSEVAFQDQWQRSELAFATVASSETQAREVLDAVERFVWSFPEVEVIAARRSWLDEEEDV
ncbi:DUF503 domain-containing protein [Aquihabitans sp. McL0605]|uniref:DUF503 domain-containing protein n=1 Tax=Aquihabitans sp. McL0605 TaxID=3415671 RepID=UPI003CFA8522